MDEELVPPELTPELSRKGRLRGAAAVKLHVGLLVGLAFCALAFRFELSRALEGNSLSWAYVGEWPFFAGFGIYFWWFVLNGRERKPRNGHRATVAPEFANMAAEWQRHQRDLLDGQAAARSRIESSGDGSAQTSEPRDMM